jgi:hypothetical protein
MGDGLETRQDRKCMLLSMRARGLVVVGEYKLVLTVEFVQHFEVLFVFH